MNCTCNAPACRKAARVHDAQERAKKRRERERGRGA